MSDIQKDFIAALVALAPEGVTARIKTEYANTGTIYYQDADFQTILGVSYNFQGGYAGFNLTKITDEEKAAIGARGTGSKPGDNDITWDGWGHVQYAKGELKQVRDGVAYLLATRRPESGKAATPQLRPIYAEEGATYTPFTDGWGVGYKVTAESKPDRWIYLYPSQTDTLDESNVFVYLDEHEPSTMKPPVSSECYITIWPTDE